MAANLRRTRSWFEEGRQDAHGGGFAGAIWAEEAEEAALFDIKGDIVDCGEIAVFFGQVLDLDYGWHCFLSAEAGGPVLTSCLTYEESCCKVLPASFAALHILFAFIASRLRLLRQPFPTPRLYRIQHRS